QFTGRGGTHIGDAADEEIGGIRMMVNKKGGAGMLTLKIFVTPESMRRIAIDNHKSVALGGCLRIGYRYRKIVGHPLKVRRNIIVVESHRIDAVLGQPEAASHLFTNSIPVRREMRRDSDCRVLNKFFPNLFVHPDYLL